MKLEDIKVKSKKRLQYPEITEDDFLQSINTLEKHVNTTIPIVLKVDDQVDRE